MKILNLAPKAAHEARLNETGAQRYSHFPFTKPSSGL